MRRGRRRMDVVILAGGFGTRLRPLTETRPKPIIPIANVPMVEHIIGRLPRKVISKVILAVNYKREFLEEYFADHDYPFEIVCITEDKPLGTGGAIKNVESHIEGDILVFNGDVVSSVDIEKMLKHHKEKGGIGTLALWEVEDPTAYGVVGLDEEDRISSFQEKPKAEEAVSNLINAGTYILNHSILDYMEPGRKTSIEREVFASGNVLERGLYGFRFAGYWEDAGTPAKLLNAQKMVLRAHWDGDQLNMRGRETMMVGEHTQMDMATKLFRPLVIGEDCVLRGGIVGPWVSMGENVSLGTQCRIENAILLDKVKLGKRVYIKDSIIGEGVKIKDDAVVEGAVIGDGEVVGE